jgi:hypothetical protein
MSASSGGHMEVVKYLCEVGGKELLMKSITVSGRMHVLMCACRHVCVQACSDAGMLSRRHTGLCRPETKNQHAQLEMESFCMQDEMCRRHAVCVDARSCPDTLCSCQGCIA